jgi:hypothetical protein
MPANHNAHDELDPVSREFYRKVMRLLNDARVPYLVGGAYALGRYTGIQRDTKDFDIFIRRADYDAVMEVLGSGAACQTELTFPHWLGKALCGDHYVDVIFSSGNGVATVDEEWFDHALEGEVLGLPVLLNPAEEMIWSKAFIQERERFDGADILHLIRARGLALDWPRLLRRFGTQWRVLLTHLVMFGFVYPSDRDQVPNWVMEDLLTRLTRETSEPPPIDRICYGTLISRAQYLIDIEKWGYRDARLVPPAVMTDAQVDRWTAAIEEPPHA